MSEKIISIAGQQHELAVERDGATVHAGSHDIQIVAVRAGEADIRVSGRHYTVPFVVQGTQVSFSFDGEIYTADVSDKGARARAKHRDHSMSAPMPGLILKILVTPGSEVEKGTPLLILEAMKMEHQINAPFAGTVRSVNCREGELVQPGVELVEVDERQE